MDKENKYKFENLYKLILAKKLSNNTDTMSLFVLTPKVINEHMDSAEISMEHFINLSLLPEELKTAVREYIYNLELGDTIQLATPPRN